MFLTILLVPLFLFSSLSAGYIPLTNADGDKKSWVLFGVTGLKVTGAGAGTSAGAFSIIDSTQNKIVDPVLDEKFEDGLIVDNHSFAKLKSLTADYVQIRVDTTDIIFNDTDPVYSMYISLYKGAGPTFVITYRSSLEGKTMEFSTFKDESNAYSITLDSSKTYSHPGYGDLIQTVAGISGTQLKKIDDIADYDFKDNPPTYQYYDKAVHQQLATGDQFLRVYSYDTHKTQWKLFDSRNSDSANDFDEFVKGKSYWAQMNSDKEAGLILGASSISTQEYLNDGDGLADGWNLLSFDIENSTIRKSSTALIVELKDNEDGGLKIWDSVGNNFIEVTKVRGGSDNIVNSILSINQTLKDAKLHGNMDQNFHLKALIIGENNNSILLVSNKRFMIDEIGGDSIGKVTTLLNKNPYTVNPLDIDNRDDSLEILDLNSSDSSKAALSKYGEYAMIIEPLVGNNTASDKEAKIYLQNAEDDAIEVEPITIGTDLQTVADRLTQTDFGGANFNSFTLNSDNNGSVDKVLIASDKTFYIKDNTFNRIFSYQESNNSSEIIITGTGENFNTQVDANSSIDDIATNLSNDPNNIYAKAIDSTLVIFSTHEEASKFNVSESTAQTDHSDILIETQIDNDLAKGAIKGVYSLDTFATAPLNNILTIKFDEFIDDENDTMSVLFTTSFGKKVVPSDTIGIPTKYSVPSTDAEAVDYVAGIEQQIKDELKLLKVVGTVTTTDHNGSVDDTNWTVTIVSQDVTNVSIDYTNADGSSAETDIEDNETAPIYGQIIKPSADLTSDLTSVPIYVPNYVVDGPLYTLKKAGFDMKAMVGGSTNLTNGEVSWESIDLTRPPSQWLSSQDYNLFNTDSSAGYWVYVQASTDTQDIILNTISFTPTYISHFNVNGITNNNISAQISLDIDGLPQVGDSDYDNSSIIELLINGRAIQLSNRSTNSIYSGEFSSYELPILSGLDYPININISDGMGTNILNKYSEKIIDFTKPNKPSIDLNATDGNNDEGTVVKITSSADVSGFYVFNDQIPDYQPLQAVNKVAEFEKSDNNLYSLCSGFGMNKLTSADQEAYKLNIIAVDGTGKIGGGNASDILRQNYIPILKNSIKLSDVNENNDTDAQTFGTVYDAQCQYNKKQDIDYGMQIRSETDADPDETVTIVYEPENATQGSPITLYFEGIDESKAKVTYSESYADSIVYIMVDDNVYSFKLLNADDATDYGTDTNPIILETDGNVTKRPEQRL